MSSALAIAGVTAVLRDLLNDGVINHDVSGVIGSTVTVSALPPDRLDTSGGNESPQLNIFLYHVTPNSGYRNVDLPSRNSRGQRTTNPPLALDLHYIISAYGSDDLQGDILLGYAMQLLHETPQLTRAAIEAALSPSPSAGAGLPAALQALADSGLENQVERIHVTPEYLSIEDMSKIWSSTQSSYRPTAAYLVSVILIESKQAALAPLPVLTRGEVDALSNMETGIVVTPELIPSVPTLLGITPPDNQLSARLGDTLTLTGYKLNGSSVVVSFSHPHLEGDLEVNVGVVSDSDSIDVNIPNNPTDWIAGLFSVSVSLIPEGGSSVRNTNQVAALIAPVMSLPPVSVIRDAGSGDVTIVVDVSPEVRPFQTAMLIVGQQSAYAEDHPVQTGRLTFVVSGLEASTSYWARLRVDGVESWLVDRSQEPPVFYGTQQIAVPA